MSIAILLVIFVAGFLFSNKYPPARFKQLRSTGWDSYSHIASWGLVFGAVSGVAVLIIDASNFVSRLFLWADCDLSYFSQSVSFTTREGLLIIWGTSSIALALIFGKLLSTKNAKKRAIVKLAGENAFELMLYDSAAQIKPVLITLNSRKVYIGVIYKIDNDESLGKTEYFSILPLWSGYRDKDSMSLKITTFYDEHYSIVREHGPATNDRLFDQFKIVICSSDVSTLSYFDIAVFHTLQPGPDDKPVILLV